MQEGLKWVKPSEEELKEFLVTQKGFNQERVAKGMQKMLKYQNSMGKTQCRLDNFFKSSGALPPVRA